MPPFELEDEVLILPFGAEGADGFAGAVDKSVGDGPRLRSAVHVHPAGEVFAIEQGEKAAGIGLHRFGKDGGGLAFKVQSRQKNGEQERLEESDEHGVKMGSLSGNYKPSFCPKVDNRPTPGLRAGFETVIYGKSQTANELNGNAALSVNSLQKSYGTS